MRPATYSTDNPPCPIDSQELQEYINALRRRIEVQHDLMASLVQDIERYKTEVEKLSIDLAIKDQHMPPGTWIPVGPS